MEDFKLKNTVNRLENEIDKLNKAVYHLRQQQQDMLDQIRRLKETNSDGSGK